MKIAVVTDLHFGCRNDAQIFNDFFRKFYSEVFFPYLEKNNITNVIVGGDVFDKRKFVNFYSLSQCKEFFFDELQKRNIHVELIVGNHDTPFKNTNKHNSCELLLKEYQNIHVMSNPEEIEMGGLKMLMLPWICDDNWEDAIKKIETTKARVIFGHLEIKDFEMYKNTYVLEGLDESLFDRFDVVASGHFHHRSKRKNIIYLGAPYPITWADFQDPRGFNVFDTEDLSFQHVENPFSIFCKVYYDDKNLSLDELSNISLDHCKNNFVKLIVSNKENTHWFDIFLDRLEKTGPAQIQIEESTVNLNTGSDSELFHETDDMGIILGRYVDQVDFDEKNTLSKFMNELYNEAFASV